jgi:hypothetical protein
MTTEQDAERRIAAWLETSPTVPATWAVDEAIEQANRISQRRFILTSTRSVPMATVFRIAAAAVVTVAIAVGAWRLLPASSGVGSAPPSAPTLPTGTFERLVPTNSAGVPAGTWTVSFSGGQAWLRGPDGEDIGFQIISTSATDVVLGGDLNPDLCASSKGPGTYAWTLAGTSLTLTSTSDAGACRSTILAGEWTTSGTP